jgi:hypothetical protein
MSAHHDQIHVQAGGQVQQVGGHASGAHDDLGLHGYPLTDRLANGEADRGPKPLKVFIQAQVHFAQRLRVFLRTGDVCDDHLSLRPRGKICRDFVDAGRNVREIRRDEHPLCGIHDPNLLLQIGGSNITIDRAPGRRLSGGQPIRC